MRVTNSIMIETVSNQLSASTDKLFSTQKMLSSGKAIEKSSDDPIRMNTVLGHRNTLASIEQYEKNIAEGQTLLQFTDSTLASVDTLLVRAKEVAVYQASGTASADTRAMAAEEVGQIYDNLMQLANTSSGGRFLFSGSRTSTIPFSRDEDYNASYAGDEGELRILAGDGVEIPTGVNGMEVFEGDAQVFDVLKDLRDALDGGDVDSISASSVRLTECLNQVVQARAKVGVNLNRLDRSSAHLGELRVKVTEMISGAEDVDVAGVMTELSSQEVAYQASLTAATRLLQSGLVELLR